jgi:hypothetical protein
MSLSALQVALGSLLLDTPPKNDRPTDKGRVTAQQAWVTVLDQFPATAFDPAHPIVEGGEPWIFLLMKKAAYYPTSALPFLVERYGDAFLACRNRAGQTPVEAVFAECVRVNEAPGALHTHMSTPFLHQVMSLTPLDTLRTPEDGGDAPGSGWLERLAKLKDNNLDEYGEQPEQALLARGANPNHRMANGQPVAGLLLHARHLQTYLEHGLDPQQPSRNPLFPNETLGDHLRGRSSKMGDLLGAHSPTETETETVTDAPELSLVEKAILRVGGQSNKTDTLAVLRQVPHWETLDHPDGTPLVWRMLASCPSVVSDLRKPKWSETFKAAIQRTDAQGRSPWFHFLQGMEGRLAEFKNEDNAAWVMAQMPPLDERVLVNGQGLYEQLMRAAWSQEEPGATSNYHLSLSKFTPHPSRTRSDGRSYTPADPLHHALMNAPQLLWWGTPEAQQQWARDTLVRLGQAVSKNPNRGTVDWFHLREILGDPQALHPELVGVMGVVNFVRRVTNYHLPSKPILPFDDTVLTSYGRPLAVTQHEIMDILRPLVRQRIEHQQVSLPEPCAPHKDSHAAQQRYREQKREVAHARTMWGQSVISWNAFSAECLAVGQDVTASTDRTLRRRYRT